MHYKNLLEKKFQENLILNKFQKSDDFIGPLKKAEINGKIEIEQRIKITENKPILAVVVGENGIGKSTEICYYARELRNKGFPVIYVKLDKKKPFNYEKILSMIFGSSDETLISHFIWENFTQNNIIPTLIIDNIHLCIESEKQKIDEKLLTYLNGTCYQRLNMSIILLTSDNDAAYEIEKCN